MRIILLILKILGIGIFGILGLILILLAFLLLIPIVYRLEGCCTDQKQLLVQVHDALHLVSFRFIKSKEESATRLRVLWMHFLEDEEEEAEGYSEEALEEAFEEEESFQSDPLETSEAKPQAVVTEDMVDQEVELVETKTDTPKVEPSRVEEPEEASDWKEKLRHIRELLEDDAAMDGFHYILNRTMRFLRRMAPKLVHYDLEFYTGEPDTTGELVGLMATIPWFYKNKKNRLLPDFSQEDPYLYGEANLGGYIQLYRAVGLLLGIYFHKNARRLIARMKRI